jgi:hypothetical protein
MEPETKPGQSPDSGKPEGLAKVWASETWEKGLEPVEEAAPKAEEKEEECPSCEKDRRAKEAAEKAKAEGKKPYKVLKVQGKEIPVESEEELLALAQKGLDYTKKTQGVADERKEMLGMKSQFQAMSEKIESLVQNFGKPAPSAVPDVPKNATEKTIFDEYGLDQELVDEPQKRMATDLLTLKRERSALQEKIDKTQEMTKMLLTKELLGMVQTTVKDTLKDFPVDDIQDEHGRSLTQAQFTSLLTQKAQAAQDKPLDELAKETIMELHEAQIRAKASATQGEAIAEDADIGEFKGKHSKLYERIAAQAVADHEATRKDVPPTLRGRGAEVSPRTAQKAEEKDDGKWTLDGALDSAFERFTPDSD